MRRSLCLLILLGFIWGSGYSIARFATTHGVSALGYAFWQTWGPAVFLLGLSALRRQALRLQELSYLRYYLVTGILGIAIPNTLMYYAASHLPAGILAVIMNVVPIMMYPLALLLRVESFHLWRILGVLVGVMGMMSLVLPKASLPDTAALPWALLCLISPLCFALCAIYASRYRPAQCTSLGLAAGMLLMAAISLTPIVFARAAFFSLTQQFGAADFAVILEIILSSIGYVLLFDLLKYAGPVYYSLVGGLVSLTGVFWGWLIFDEHLKVLSFIAISLIFIAIYVVALHRAAYVPSS